MGSGPHLLCIGRLWQRRRGKIRATHGKSVEPSRNSADRRWLTHSSGQIGAYVFIIPLISL
jgi:hypothetical protein